MNMEKHTFIKINIPSNVNYIIEKLNKNGYEAYIVGGCVRDSLLERIQKDWDITTSATPEEVKECFNEKIFDTGIKHGTVSLLIDNELYEITTYRIDGDYSDGRHPDEVKFTRSLEEDLKRRDFTINAMAYHPKYGLVDLFDGKKDLDYGIIRAVGCPDTRFNEDGLRIMRAIRFAARYDFEIEEKTDLAIYRNKKLLLNISAERINSEFSQILIQNNAYQYLDDYREIFAVFIPEIEDMFDCEQIHPHHKYDVWNHTLYVVKNIPDDLIYRLSALLHDIGKPSCRTFAEDGHMRFKGHPQKSYEISKSILKRLKYDNKTSEEVLNLILHHDDLRDVQVSENAVKRYLNKVGPELLNKLFVLRSADVLAQSEEYFDEKIKKIFDLKQLTTKILEEEQCFSLKDMNLNGDDLIKLGFKPGKIIGEILKDCLDKIISNDLENDHSTLINYVRENFEIKRPQSY